MSEAEDIVRRLAALSTVQLGTAHGHALVSIARRWVLEQEAALEPAAPEPLPEVEAQPGPELPGYDIEVEVEPPPPPVAIHHRTHVVPTKHHPPAKKKR
jgi:hypothetical protein